jgi:ABC-type sugar transport system substrate-binding protein
MRLSVHRASVLVVGMCGLSIALAACGGDDSSSDGGSGADSKRKIAVVMPDVSNPYWTALKDGAETEAKRLGVGVNVQAPPTATVADVEEQAKTLQNLIPENYDCYVAAPAVDTNLIQPVAEIAEKGKPVVVADGPWNYDAAEAAGAKIETHLASNNLLAGEEAGKAMAGLLGGEGDVAIVGGPEGNTSAANRRDGFTKTAEAGGLKVVQAIAADYDREKALNGATDILRARRDIKGFFAANDLMALGIAKALENAHRTDVKIVGLDGIEDALEAIKNGRMSATVSQYPYAEGIMSIDACVRLIDGESVPEKADSPINVINSDNVEDAIEVFPKPSDDFENPYAIK